MCEGELGSDESMSLDESESSPVGSGSASVEGNGGGGTLKASRPAGRISGPVKFSFWYTIAERERRRIERVAESRERWSCKQLNNDADRWKHSPFILFETYARHMQIST